VQRPNGGFERSFVSYSPMVQRSKLINKINGLTYIQQKIFLESGKIWHSLKEGS
jgi:hypothetical protein